MYSHVFTAVKLGPVEVANRLYFAPHGIPQSLAVSDDFAYYCAERAAGGVGLVVHSTAAGAPPTTEFQLPHQDAVLPSFVRTAELVHEHGAKIFAQVSYWLGAPGVWESYGPMRPWLSPSLHGHYAQSSAGHEMSREDIRWIIGQFALGAANLRRAGYDGIEMHATHGMLVETFLSPFWNQRTDEYGGGFENRLRFARELLEAVRNAAGEQMAVGLRLNCDEMLPGGYGQTGARAILRALCADRLVDFVDLDAAVEPDQAPLVVPSYQLPKFTYEESVRGVRDAAGRVPVLSALGRVNSVADAERALADGSCDMVGCARGLIAEPHLVAHARAGSEHRSRACTSCNYCLQQISRGMGMTCAINPATMRERRWSPRLAGTAPVRRRVVVIGGGPAGLEASRMAAQRGHEVTLLERADAVGGQYRMWAKLPGREIVATAIEFYERELPCLGVDVRLGSEASATDVFALGAEAVVVCTGAEYSPAGVSGFSPQPIPGAEQPFVYTPEQILSAEHLPRGRVLVLDDEGLNTAVGIAELVARQGAHVELVTRWLHVAHNLADTMELPAITTNLLTCGVTLRPRTFVRKIAPGEVVIYDVLTDVDQTLTDIDAVVLCTLRLPRAELHRELDGAVDQLFVAGDASGTRDHAAAFYEGALFAHMIGQPGAPRNFTEAYYHYQPATPHAAAPPLHAPAASQSWPSRLG